MIILLTNFVEKYKILEKYINEVLLWARLIEKDLSE